MLALEQKKQPFSWHERHLLLRLVHRYKRCIESRRADSASLAAKQRAWEKVTQEYNLTPNVTPRDVKQLKKCLDNMKSKAKRCNAMERSDVIPAFSRSSADEEEEDMDGEIAMDAFYNRFVNDSEVGVKVEGHEDDDPGDEEFDCSNSQEARETVSTAIKIVEFSTCRGEVQSFPGSSTQNTDLSSPSGTRSRSEKSVQTAADLAELELGARLDKIRAEKEALLKFHELKMKLAKEESAAKTKLLQQKFENARMKERLLALQIGRFGFGRTTGSASS